MSGSDLGIASSDFETDDARPVAAWCDDAFIHVTLADGRRIGVPLWWYPFLDAATPGDRAVVELEYSGIWWPVLDEGVSVKGILLGWKAPNARAPQRAA